MAVVRDDTARITYEVDYSALQEMAKQLKQIEAATGGLDRLQKQLDDIAYYADYAAASLRDVADAVKSIDSVNLGNIARDMAGMGTETQTASSGMGDFKNAAREASEAAKFDQMTQELSVVGSNAMMAASAFDDMYAAMASLNGARQIQYLTDGLNDVQREAQRAGTYLEDLDGIIVDLPDDAIREIANDIEQVGTRAGQSEKEAEQLKDALRDVGGTDVDSVSSGLKDIGYSAQQSEGHVSKLGVSLKSVLQAVGVIELARQGLDLLRDSFSGAVGRIDVMDQFNRTMTVMTGNASDVAVAMDAVRDSVTGTGYGLDTAALAVQNFVTRGLEMDNATLSVSRWADAVSFFGDGTNDTFAGVTDSLSKMVTRNKVMMDDMNEILHAGIPAIDIYAAQVGKSTLEVTDQMSKGELATEDFLNAMNAAFEEGVGRFPAIVGAAQEAGASWRGTMDNFKVYAVRGVMSIVEGTDEALEQMKLPQMRDMIKDLGLSIESGLGWVAERIPTLLSGLPSLIEGITGFFNGFKSTTLYADLKRIGETFKDMGTQIMQTVGVVGPQISKFIQNLTSNLGKSLSTDLKNISDNVLPSLLGVVEILSQKIDYVAPAAATFFGLKGAVKYATPVIKALGKVNAAMGNLGDVSLDGLTGLRKLSVYALTFAKNFKVARAETDGLFTAFKTALGPTGMFKLTTFGFAAIAAGAVAAGVAFYRHVTKPAREAKEALGEMAQGLVEASANTRDAEADLSKYGSAFSAINSRQDSISGSMNTLQEQINDVLRRKTEDRAGIMSEDLENIRAWYAELDELTNEYISDEQRKMDMIERNARRDLSGSSLGFDAYKAQANSYIADLQEQSDIILDLIDETRIARQEAVIEQWDTARAANPNMSKDELNALRVEYAAGMAAVDEWYAEQAFTSTQGLGNTASLVASEYNRMLLTADGFGDSMAAIETAREQRAAQHASDLLEIQGRQYATMDDMRQDTQTKELSFSNDMQNMALDWVNGMSDTQKGYVNELMNMAVRTEMYGGEIDESTRKTLDSIIDMWAYLPEEVRESYFDGMQPFWDGLKEEDAYLFELMAGKEGSLYAAAQQAASGIPNGMTDGIQSGMPDVAATIQSLNDIMIGATDRLTADTVTSLHSGTGRVQAAMGPVSAALQIPTGAIEEQNYKTGLAAGSSAADGVNASMGQIETAMSGFDAAVASSSMAFGMELQNMNIQLVMFNTVYITMMAAMVTTTQTSMTQMQQAVATGAQQITAEMAGMVTTMVAILAPLPVLMYSAGFNAMSGLLQGIQAQKGAVLAEIAAITSAIANIPRADLNMNSPSRVMMEIGSDAMEGLNLGLQSQQPTTEEIAYSIQDLMPSYDSDSGGTFTTTNSSQGGDTINHVTYTITITPQKGESDSAYERRIAGIVREEIEKSNKKLLRTSTKTRVN